MSLRTLSARMVRSYMPKHTRAVPFALYRYYASAYRLFRLSTAQVLEHVCRRVTCHPSDLPLSKNSETQRQVAYPQPNGARLHIHLCTRSLTD
ncbi:hypothetical protein BC936DRAFT_136910 [Jimgerdemannia flammicorona]|uniref:Uncharacterized protein n=1 Tax=Jimgerdemannia flammicorona TaxID=994334 RepID=A0A433CYJ9_9FUNG|nr:hypothetical protein BC936DRAFT_136910 [Jimgerdemannia flammicorona]